MESSLIKVILLLSYVLFVIAKAKNPVFCEPTNQELTIDDECSKDNTLLEKIECSIIFNRTEDLKKIQDDYSYTSFFKKIFPVFSLDGKVFTTRCENISNIEFPRHVDKCTKDLPVTFYRGGLKSNGYMNKEGIVRGQNTYAECNNAVQVYNIQDEEVAKGRHKLDDARAN